VRLPLILALAAQSLTVTVFYDENGNGARDPTERVVLPDVTVAGSGWTARTGTDGRVRVDRASSTPEPLRIDPESLPPYYVAEPAAPPEPGAHDLAIGVTLPIGDNSPNTYLAFGDSITAGEGARAGKGYPSRLEALLRSRLGAARVIEDGVAGITTDRGLRRLKESLVRAHPAYTLILIGTNDWDETADPAEQATTTAEHVRLMVRRARGFGSLPVVLSLIPPNVGFDDRVPPARDAFVKRVNELLSAVSREEKVLFVDLEGAYRAETEPGRLFKDHLHPNDLGHGLIAAAVFRALTTPRTP
jgi:lysophospholipase L1-like esterase